MALGIDEDRTIIVEIGKLRAISDTEGRHVIRLTNSSEDRRSLVNRLKTAGCPADDHGNDWLKTGDFDSAIKNPSEY